VQLVMLESVFLLKGINNEQLQLEDDVYFSNKPVMLENLSIPLYIFDQLFGIIVWYADPDVINERFRQLATTVSNTLTAALSNLTLRKKLEEQSVRDPLTGLFNRRYLEESMQAELTLARKNQESIAVLMIDIDHFKQFNDRYGHAAGDQALLVLGKVLRTSIREQDIACRYGGEEFVVILPDVTTEVAMNRAEDLRLEALSMKILLLEEHNESVKISIGIAMYPFDGENMEELLRRADKALYRAKAQGGNKVVSS